MNKDNAKDFLPIVQALADGKTIQYKNLAGNWVDCPDVGLNCGPDSYRVKPEPLEFDLWFSPNDLHITNTDMSSRRWRKIRVREIV